MTPEESSLLIIDVQEKLLPAMDEKEEIFENICRLVKGATTLEIPTIATEQYPKGLGVTVPELMQCYRGNIPTFPKTSFNALEQQEVLDWLRGVERTNVFICGMESHICVRQTALDLKRKGFYPIVIADCVASRKKYDKEIAIRSMELEGVEITTLESAFYELLRDSKHPAFKEISKLIK